MTIEIDPSKKILLDADVIIHFIKAGRLGTLSLIFPNKLYLLDVVFEEVFKGKLRSQVEIFSLTNRFKNLACQMTKRF